MKIKADIFQLQDLLATVPAIAFHPTRVNIDFFFNTSKQEIQYNCSSELDGYQQRKACECAQPAENIMGSKIEQWIESITEKLSEIHKFGFRANTPTGEK